MRGHLALMLTVVLTGCGLWHKESVDLRSDDLRLFLASARNSQKISIHVGLNAVNSRLYGWPGICNSCEFDAGELSFQAKQAGFIPIELIGSRWARAECLKQALDDAAATLKPGGVLLLTLSMHGSYFDAADNTRDELLCLYDGEM